MIPKSGQKTDRSLRHCRHLPQANDGLMTTSSPTCQRVTPFPKAATVPAPSQPGTIGNIGGLGIASRIQRSRWLRALVTTLTQTSPGPGSGRSTSP